MSTRSSKYGTNGTIQSPDRRDFTGNTKKTPLWSALSRPDLNSEQDLKDVVCDIGNSEDGEILATKPNNERRAHAHHNTNEISFCFEVDEGDGVGSHGNLKHFFTIQKI